MVEIIIALGQVQNGEGIIDKAVTVHFVAVLDNVDKKSLIFFRRDSLINRVVGTKEIVKKDKVGRILTKDLFLVDKNKNFLKSTDGTSGFEVVIEMFLKNISKGNSLVVNVIKETTTIVIRNRDKAFAIKVSQTRDNEMGENVQVFRRTVSEKIASCIRLRL